MLHCGHNICVLCLGSQCVLKCSTCDTTETGDVSKLNDDNTMVDYIGLLQLETQPDREENELLERTKRTEDELDELQQHWTKPDDLLVEEYWDRFSQILVEMSEELKALISKDSITHLLDKQVKEIYKHKSHIGMLRDNVVKSNDKRSLMNELADSLEQLDNYKDKAEREMFRKWFKIFRHHAVNYVNQNYNSGSRVRHQSGDSHSNSHRSGEADALRSIPSLSSLPSTLSSSLSGSSSETQFPIRGKAAAKPKLSVIASEESRSTDPAPIYTVAEGNEDDEDANLMGISFSVPHPGTGEKVIFEEEDDVKGLQQRDAELLEDEVAVHPMAHFYEVTADSWIEVPEGTAAEEEKFLKGPSGIVVLPSGDIAICDKLHHQVKIFNLELNQVVTEFGKEGTGYGEFQFPRGISVTRDGNILVCDTVNHRLQLFNTKGEFERTFGTRGNKQGEFDHLWNVVIDRTNGEIYVPEGSRSGRKRIQVFDEHFGFLREFGDGYLEKPVGIDIRGSYAIVSDVEEGKCELFTKEGIRVREIGGLETGGDNRLGKPADVCFDNRGNIIVADFEGEKIQIFDRYGAHVRSIVHPNSEVAFKPTRLEVASVILEQHPEECIVVSDHEFDKLYIIRLPKFEDCSSSVKSSSNSLSEGEADKI